MRRIQLVAIFLLLFQISPAQHKLENKDDITFLKFGNWLYDGYSLSRSFAIDVQTLQGEYFTIYKNFYVDNKYVTQVKQLVDSLVLAKFSYRSYKGNLPAIDLPPALSLLAIKEGKAIDILYYKGNKAELDAVASRFDEALSSLSFSKHLYDDFIQSLPADSNFVFLGNYGMRSVVKVDAEGKKQLIAIASKNDPLVVIDGKLSEMYIFEKMPKENILSIKVLRDPVDTALYGSRGANGVIIVETKKVQKTPSLDSH